MKISIIGCGNIGRTIIKAIADGVFDCEISGIFDVSREGFNQLPGNVRKKLNLNSKFAQDFNEFLSFDSELVIEAASQKAVREYALPVLSSNKSLMVMSVGALVDEELFENMKNVAGKNKNKIYIPSGAIAGLDGVKAAKIAGLKKAELVTRKPPESLGIESNCKKVLYEGPAGTAVKLFPKNVNVAAALSLTALGFEKTTVKIIADPGVENNIHEIHIKGKFGKIKTVVENVPSPDNPRTSYLASLSAIAMLKRITESVQIGT